MNGYGHFVPGLVWSITYWTAIFAVLAVISIAFARRGAEDSWRARAQQAWARLPRLTPALVLFALIAIGSGWWFYYNAHVLNEYLTTKQQRDIQASYERNFKRYERLPQPKVIAVDANIDLDPAIAAFRAPATSCCRTRRRNRSRRSTSRTRCSPSPMCSSTAPSTW